MSTATPEIQDLARQLIAFEAENESASDLPTGIALQVVLELRARLIRLTGIEGFQSLLSRALALARMDEPILNMVRINPDGSLEGFDQIESSQEAGKAEQSALVLVSHLLELLMTFIGTSLTLRLLQDRWPDAQIERANRGVEGKT